MKLVYAVIIVILLCMGLLGGVFISKYFENKVEDHHEEVEITLDKEVIVDIVDEFDVVEQSIEVEHH